MQMWFKPYGHVVEMWPLEQSLHQEALTCITSTSHENSMKLHCIRLHTVAYTVAHIQMHTYIIIIYIYTYYINIFTTYIFIYVCRNAHAQTYLYIYMRNFFVIQQQLLKCFTTFCAGYPQTGLTSLKEVVLLSHVFIERLTWLQSSSFLGHCSIQPSARRMTPWPFWFTCRARKRPSMLSAPWTASPSCEAGDAKGDTSHPAMERPHVAGISQWGRPLAALTR